MVSGHGDFHLDGLALHPFHLDGPDAATVAAVFESPPIGLRVKLVKVPRNGLGAGKRVGHVRVAFHGGDREGGREEGSDNLHCCR
jgi:hypothetical protein